MSANGGDVKADRQIRLAARRQQAVRFLHQESAEIQTPSALWYSWVAIFGFYILTIETGVRTIMNIFVEPVIAEFNCTKTVADTAVIVIPMASSMISGPLCAMFYHFAGARISIMIGSTMCSIGFAAGSFVHTPWLVCVCMLFFGLGTGLMRNAIISVQCEYFKTAQHRNTVHAFMTIGPGLGIWLMPRLLVYIIKEYSWQIAWQALSTLYIVSFIMGIFITRRPSDENSSIWSMTGIKIWNKLEFCLHGICTFCAAACSIIYISNILILMRNENIPDPEKVYSYQGIASIAGKGLLTLLMSFNKIDIAWLIIACYVIAQTALFSGAFCYSLWQFRLQNFFSGFGIGLFQAALVPFLVALVGATQLPAALGFTNLVSGLAAFSAINIAGRVAKEYDDERRPFVISMFLGSIAIVLAIINSLLHKFRKSHVRRPSMKQYSRVNGVKNLSEITSFEGQ